MSLEGKVALVTGAGRNVGRATVLELARRGAFLASDDASFITGQTIHVNGGALAY